MNLDYATKIPVVVVFVFLLDCQTCCHRVSDKSIKGLLFWKMRSDTAVLLWQPEVFHSKSSLPMQAVWGHVKNQKKSSHTFFKDSQEGFIVSVCAEQTGRLYLQSSRGRLLILAAWAVHLSPLVPHLLSSSSSLPPLRIKWLFVLPQRCLSLVSPPLPSPLLPILPSGTERIFWGIDFICPVHILKDCGYLCLSVSENGVLCKKPPSLSPSLYEGQVCLAPVSASALMLNKPHASRKDLWIVIITSTGTAIYFNSFE